MNENTLSEDYENRCGNCHEYMSETDKYCKLCGTKRGEGKFEPYENDMYCVYGPPIKQLYRCQKCGHRWITATLGGLHESKFCPECGTSFLKMEKREVRRFIDVIGEIPDPEDSTGSQLLTEEEVYKILALRTTDDEELTFEKKISLLMDAGFQEFQYIQKPEKLTEQQGEKINLVRLLLDSKGNNPLAYSETCPLCSSPLICGMAYSIHVFENQHIRISGDEVYVNAWHSIDLDKKDENTPAFKCMQCGHLFRNFMELYRKHCI